MLRPGPIARLTVLSLVFTLTCDQRSTADEGRGAVAAATRAARAARRFDPSVVKSEPGSAVADALEGIRSEQWAATRQRADAALSDADELTQGRLRWLAAQAAIGAGDDEAALEYLAGLRGSEHPLALWAALRVAAILEEDHPQEAAEVASQLPEGWAGTARARLIEARSLAASGQIDEAIPKLRAIVAGTANHVGAASAGMPLARLLEGQSNVESREEALALYRRVATRAPSANVGRQAAAAADRVLATLPAERQRALRTIPLDDRWMRAQAHFNSRQYEEAEREFTALAAALAADPARSCEARSLVGQSMLRRRQRDRGAAYLVEVADQCEDVDVKAWSRYRAGRALSRRGHYDQAIAQYEAVEREAPTHRLADDCLFRAAISDEAAGRMDSMVARLSALPSRYPEGDMRPEAVFKLAWLARQAGDHAAALGRFEQLLREGPGEDAEDISGRAAYWRARSLGELGRRDDAVAGFARIARGYPLSYYAQQSLARLQELAPARATAIRAEMRVAVEQPLRFPWRAEMNDASFARTLELLRVRAYDEAEKELRAMGALGEGSDPDMLWLTAALLDRAGALPRSSRLVRRRLPSFRRTMPTGQNRELWRLAYPKAYAPLIEEAAERHSLPAAFVRAIAREESAFDPHAVSGAQAYGLIQIILPTARHYASAAGVRATPQTLQDPATNLAVGTAFMAWLWERYSDNPAVIPSAYNAGHGALDRWLRERGGRPLDVFIEDIPYDETRRYTRRVLQTFGTYAWLDTGTLPPLAVALPVRN